MTLRQWWAGRGPWLVALLALALWYYGGYVRAGINFRDEGGTVALVAQRLLAGERPLVEVVLGYNVLWFYPVVGLFKLFGVNFVLLRGYCFFLSTVTAVTGFCTVSRAAGRPWVGFLAGVLLVVVPGMTFKNYMPLLAVTNGACLFHYALAAPERRGRWQVAGGLLLGLTLLIRIDVGVFVTGLWVGLLALRAVQEKRALPALRGLAVILALVFTLHLPVWLDARHRGFDRPFVKQYVSWPQSLVQQLGQRFHPAPPRPALTVARAAGPVPEKNTLPRLTWAHWGKARNTDERLLILLIYAPLLSLGLLAGWATGRLGLGWWRGEEGTFTPALAALGLLGAACTVFPQYFFFRPDSPHISEFSPGFWVATIGALALLARGGGQRVLASLVALLLTAHAGIFLWRMVPDRWAGTRAAAKNRTQYFEGENGVHVYVSRTEFEGLTQIRKVIQEHTERSDYLVAYPYQPSFNVLADRRTYEKNVYVDNAIAEPGWNGGAIARLEKYHPAVIILSDWAINGTEASRFSVWAAPTRAWIQEHYDEAGAWLDFQVFVRRAPAE